MDLRNWIGKRDSQDFLKSSHQGLYALHIDIKTVAALGIKSLIEKALKSTVIKAYTNLPLLLVLVLTYKTPE